MPKFTYNIDPETLFEFIADHPCKETRMLVDEILESIDRVEGDADASGNKEFSKGVAHAVEYIQAALEDYLTWRSAHECMKWDPPTNPERN